MSPITSIALSQLFDVGQKFEAAQTTEDKRVKVSHEGFNLFTTLLKEDDEVRLHTRFIHCLLNPKGSHNCGQRFLELLFQVIKDQGAKDHEGATASIDLPPNNWQVRKEVSCHPYGQIDLLLERADFGVAIENKLNAAEQDRQLECYSAYLHERFGANSCLLYLTKNGKRGDTHAGCSYLRISYESHVLDWLSRCILETPDNPPVKGALEQYRRVIQQLVGKTTKAETMTEISTYIAQNTDLLRYREQIKRALDEARENFLNRMAEGITIGLGTEFETHMRPDLPQFGAHSEGSLILKSRGNSPLLNLPIHICVQNWVEGEALVVGIEVTLPLTDHELQILKSMDVFLARTKADRKHAATKTRPTGWHNLEEPFNDDKIGTLMKAPMDDFVSRLCADIRAHVQLLEQAYGQALANSGAKNQTPSI